MTVPESYTPTLVAADGILTDYDFDFSILDQTDLVVTLVLIEDTTDVTDQELGVDYTVTINPSTRKGTITFATAPEDTYYVSIRRSRPQTQVTNIPAGGLFREKQIENALDSLEMQIQELAEALDRSILLSEYAIEQIKGITFPAPEADKIIGWNADGDALENKVAIDEDVVAAAEEAVTAAEAAQADAEAAQAAAEAAAATFTLASQAEAEAGTENTKYMTPLRTQQNFEANILDEDDMASDSAVLPPSQQSVKAYVDAQAYQYVDRGDPSAVDFAVGDLTTDGAWHDLDLSSIVPSGATAVVLQIELDDNAIEAIKIRENGNSNTVNVLTVRNHVTGTNVYAQGIVACDTNRVVEYLTSNTTYSTINITVAGWFI